MKLTYQPIIREFSIYYQYKQIDLKDRGLLLHLYLHANPKTGIYMTHARRLAEETGSHVETIRQSQKRLKRAGLLIYKHAQTARLRPYFLTGFILFKTEKKDMHMTRTLDDMLKVGRKQKIFNNRTTERQVIEFLDRAGDTWVNSFFTLFAKKVSPETVLLEAPAIDAVGDLDGDGKETGAAVPAETDVSGRNQAARSAFLKDAGKIFGAAPN